MGAKAKIVESAVDALGKPIGALADYLKEFAPKTYYHFSPEPDIKEFKINEPSPFDDGSERGAVYFTSDPKYAEEVMEEITQGEYDEFPGMSTYPVKIKKGKIFDHTNEKQIKKLLKAGLDDPKQYENEFYIRPFYTGESYAGPFEVKYPTIERMFNEIKDGNYQYLEMPRVQELMKEQGYRGYTTAEPGTVGLFYPDKGDVRSVFAKFDPSKSKKGEILASVPVAGALGGLGAMDGTSSD